MPTLVKQIGNPRGAFSHVVILRKHNFVDFSLCTCSVLDSEFTISELAGFSPFYLLSVVGWGWGRGWGITQGPIRVL